MPENQKWWKMSITQVLDLLGSTEKGISGEEAQKRLKINGQNVLPSTDKTVWWKILASQFTNGLLLILIFAALIAFVMGDRIEAGVIFAIIVINSGISFFQEYKAGKAIEKLRAFIAHVTKVFRSGEPAEISVENLVLGDVVFLHIGDIVPADLRLISVEEFSVNESALTGESLPVQKIAEIIETDSQEPVMLTNMAFMGTVVVSGSAQGVVIGTGKNTYIGTTAMEISVKEPEADFQKNIRKFSGLLVKVMASMTIFVFVANTLLGKPVFESFLFAIALAVGLTPEALPVILTITLTNGAMRIAKKKVVVKKLAAVEDLGNMDTLCCDKTGTLTEGKLNLVKYLCCDDKKNEDVLLAGLLCSKIYGSDGHKLYGNPLDEALWISPLSEKTVKLTKNYKILDENEFDFERKRMSVVVSSKEGSKLIVKGTCEALTDISGKIKTQGQEKTLDEQDKKQLASKCSAYEAEGYRVIAVGERDIAPTAQSTKDDEHDLTFIGFLLFQDPPRKTVKKTLKTFSDLGVRVKIISGDGAVITATVCKQVGLLIVEDKVITGDMLEALSEKEFSEYAEKYNVFARINPGQKYRLVASLNRGDHVVGFLGDGINDAPALKVADVGISVDTGTDIAKDTADIIMLEKRLGVLADGIIEGRKTFGNITKYIKNTVSANLGNMTTVSASSMFLSFLPLLPGQILLNNFLSDVPMLTIATDRIDVSQLKRPRHWDLKVIFRFMLFFGLISTFFDLALILPLLFIWHASPEIFRTAWFVESTLSEMLVTFIIRTKLPFWKSMPSSYLIISSLLSILFALALPGLVFGKELFSFVPLPSSVWLLVAGVLTAYMTVTEIAKHIFYKKYEND